MPTYQYVCTNPEGKHEFEVVQSFTDDPVSVCPECAASVRKVYGSVGVVFKGSGFYRTDSRAGAKAAEAGAKTGSSGDSSTSSTSNSSSSSSSSDSSKSSTSSDSSPSTSSSSSSGSKAAAS